MKLGKSKKLGVKKTTTKKPEPRVKSKDTDAKAAVKEFETARDEYYEAKDEWENTYEEASNALRELEDRRQGVEQAQAKAKKAVAEAEMTIGNFQCQLPKTSSGYDGEKLLHQIVATAIEDADPMQAANYLAKLHDLGVIKAVVVNKEAATVVHQQGEEELKDLLDTVFDPGGKRLSTRVIVPKW